MPISASAFCRSSGKTSATSVSSTSAPSAAAASPPRPIPAPSSSTFLPASRGRDSSDPFRAFFSIHLARMIDASQTVVPRWLVLGACESLQVEPKSGSSTEVEVWVLKRSKSGLF